MQKYRVDPSAVVESSNIGEGTKIWHFTHIMPGASIGKDVTIGQCCFIGNDVVIGDRCKIQNSVNIFQPARIGDEVFIGPGVTFCNVMRPRAIIEQKGNFLTTVIARGATIGANATILPGIHIGMFAFVAAGAVVTKDVPSHALVAGNPARLLYWVDFLGYQTCPEDVKEGC